MATATAQPTKHLYRSLLRELRLSSINPRATRNPTANQQVRALVLESKDAAALDRTLQETRDFLRANRKYGELLKRYNPTHGMSQQERVKATARRVGLDDVESYSPEKAAEEGKDKTKKE